ncbi:MAG: hypothetical protein K2H14_08765 [Muribaculaceae bacterium]|nr:hypothetical protein [Muribaculaceae bacterium]
MKKTAISLLAASIVTGAIMVFAAGENPENIYLYRNGALVYTNGASAPDSIALEENKTRVAVYNTDGKVIFSAPTSEIDSLTFSYSAPVADLLDIRFNADGTVYDASPMHNNVEVISPDGKVSTTYNETYGCYSGNFTNSWGTGSLGNTPNYCKVDYRDNQAFIYALASGHSIETLFLARYEAPIPNLEAKWFTSHEAGGTGLMICQSNATRGNEITFLPNITENGNSTWRWATSGVVPQPYTYYHVVGVWDKEMQVARIYVNGELKNTVSAPGSLRLAPNEAARWFAVGCDAGPSEGQFGGDWEIVTAKVYGSALSELDIKTIYNTSYNPDYKPEPEPDSNLPVADLLDIRFNADGTASDISPMHNAVESVTGDVTTHYSPAFNGYFARLNNKWSNDQGVAGYYKVDYSNNQKFQDALADGHTLEALVTANYDGLLSDNNKEAKFFSSHEAGGTGLMISTSAAGRGQELTYLVNVTTNGASNWQWGNSGIEPAKSEYYHIIGIWNKAEGKAYTYINGELKKTVETAGDYRPATAGNRWFGIGCDAGPTPQLAWKGDIVTARVYDKPLTPDEVAALWADTEQKLSKVTPDMVSGISFYSGLALTPGSSISINGNGFAEGDIITLMTTDNTTSLTPLATSLTDNGVSAVLPSDITGGTYRLMLTRGDNMQDLGQIRLNIVETIPAGARVIAHRGYWQTAGSAQNSRTALQKAQEIEAFGSETDIWITSDNVLMVNHDASYNGVTIQNSTAATCRTLTLPNGEKMPEFQELLDIIKNSDSPTLLIIEIKEHSSAQRDREAASATVAAVKAAGLENKVEYISFSMNACEQVIADDPEAKVAYVRGGQAPSVLHAKGYTGINYNIAEFRTHPEWVKEAHDLGMTVTAWTLNSPSDIIEMMNLGVDFVTTDTPVEALAIKAIYDSNAR